MASPFSPATEVKVPHSCTVTPTSSTVFGRATVAITKNRRPATIGRKISRFMVSPYGLNGPTYLTQQFQNSPLWHLLHQALVEERGKRFNFVFLQFQVRHFRRLDARICEKFPEVIRRKPLAREVELGVSCVFWIYFHVTVATDAALGREQ